jgi:hypothetical protein
MADSTGKQTFKGSCHCGFITYTVAVDPAKRKATRCNCTWCQKPVFTNLDAEKDDFKLLTPGSWDEVSNYNPKKLGVNRWFCSQCGTHFLREVGLHSWETEYAIKHAETDLRLPGFL